MIAVNFMLLLFTKRRTYNFRIQETASDNGRQVENSYGGAFLNYDMDEDKLRDAELALQFKS